MDFVCIVGFFYFVRIAQMIKVKKCLSSFLVTWMEPLLCISGFDSMIAEGNVLLKKKC